jgi:hypothetical protein
MSKQLEAQAPCINANSLKSACLAALAMFQ